MKIGSGLGLQWWNRVSLGGVGGVVGTEFRRKEGKGSEVRKICRAGVVRFLFKDLYIYISFSLFHRSKSKNKTTFNTHLSLSTSLSPSHSSLRLIVHQKALYDLNERAVSAVSIPTKLVPVFGEGVKVVIPRPEGAGWGDEGEEAYCMFER